MTLGNPNAKFCDIDCDQLVQIGEERICKVASDAQGRNIPANPYFCSICLTSPNPKTLGNRGVKITTRKSNLQRENDLSLGVDERIGEGAGSELHKMIPKFLESKTCSCKDWAKKMNIWGPDKCEEYRVKIVDKLVEESKKRSIFGWVPEAATKNGGAGLFGQGI